MERRLSTWPTHETTTLTNISSMNLDVSVASSVAVVGETAPPDEMKG